MKKFVVPALFLCGIGYYIIQKEKTPLVQEVEPVKVAQKINSELPKPERLVPMTTKPKPQVIQKPESKVIAPELRRRGPITAPSKTLIAEENRIDIEGYGRFPKVDLDNLNSHKKHVLKALENPSQNGGSLSVVGPRETFDPERYKNDPDYYINTVEPGRAFDTAKQEEGVTPLKRLGSHYHETIQNQSVSLGAQSSPNMPISFTAFDGGEFQNGLGFITLKADSRGIAWAEFTPTTGVINQCRIRAASPVHSQTLTWRVWTQLPPKE